MGETTCPTCGAAVTHGVTESGESVPLDKIEEPSTGEGRYRVTQWSDPPKIVPIDPNYETPASVDHRVICERGRA